MTKRSSPIDVVPRLDLLGSCEAFFFCQYEDSISSPPLPYPGTLAFYFHNRRSSRATPYKHSRMLLQSPGRGQEEDETGTPPIIVPLPPSLPRHHVQPTFFLLLYPFSPCAPSRTPQTLSETPTSYATLSAASDAGCPWLCTAASMASTAKTAKKTVSASAENSRPVCAARLLQGRCRQRKLRLRPSNFDCHAHQITNSACCLALLSRSEGRA